MNSNSSATASIVRIVNTLFLVIFLLSLTELGWTGTTETGKGVAAVGKTVITEKEISYKVQIEKAYGNEGATRDVGLISLVNDTIEYEVATFYGITITRDEIDSFKQYVDEHTKAPEILEKVKRLFGDDWSSYERIYLAPKIINWKLHDFYSRSAEIHKKERDLIEKAYGLVVAGKRFQEAAQEWGMEFSAIHVEEKGTSLHPELHRYIPRNSTPLKDPLIPLLENLIPGEIYRNIVEDDYGYRILKLVGRSGETYSVEIITINKRPYDEWFREAEAKIEIDIADPDLKNNIKTKYPAIWWVKKLLSK